MLVFLYRIRLEHYEFYWSNYLSQAIIFAGLLWPNQDDLGACFGDPYGNRTRVTSVKGRCPNR